MFKIINKTNQTFSIIGYGYLYPYGYVMVNEKTEQILGMEKKGLVSIKNIH